MSVVVPSEVTDEVTRCTDDDGLDHVVCCFDSNGVKALCGLDVSDDPWGGGGTANDCVVCADLEAARFCPFGRKCP